MLKPGCDEEEKCRFMKKCIFSVTFETLKKTVPHESDYVIEVQCLNNGELIAISLFQIFYLAPPCCSLVWNPQYFYTSNFKFIVGDTMGRPSLQPW